MNTMTRTRPIELRACCVPLTPGPAAAAEARNQVRAVIAAWDAPVDADVAVLLTSDLVTHVIRQAAGEPLTLAVRCVRGQLRVEVHGASRSLPVHPATWAYAEAGPGLVLVATLSDEWGSYPTPEGRAEYFALVFRPDLD